MLVAGAGSVYASGGAPIAVSVSGPAAVREGCRLLIVLLVLVLCGWMLLLLLLLLQRSWVMLLLLLLRSWVMLLLLLLRLLLARARIGARSCAAGVRVDGVRAPRSLWWWSGEGGGQQYRLLQ